MIRLPWPFSRGVQNQEDRPPIHEPSQHRPRSYDSSYEDCTDWDVPDPRDKTRRVSFGSHSTIVYGHPSTGGVLVLEHCNGVDLNFLGLPRFETASSSDDPVAEDLHCARMRQLGAWYFRSVYEYDLASCGMGDEDLNNRKVVIAAWPQSGSGVWVLVIHRWERGERGEGVVRNAFSMDERCEVVKKLGGRFYSDPKECLHLEL
ncbi:uncharacterized protein DNG_00065 [Cephalotrichum gorgonifer]|uniref:Uncharacterized protein n=1 Tax=Cephalotrichum gorgonifer TaxID=2041049 RepID=A0AAE8SQT6_9PEZI|nr:uncharacterized protein DNG_00065 [Cephalotrichum gorgonifer]